MQELRTDAKTEVCSNSELTFDGAVFEKIAGFEASKIDGILTTNGNMFEKMTENFSSGENITKGISADVSDDTVTIDMDGTLAYDADAVSIHRRLCDSVSEKVKRMTGFNVEALNLHVTDMLTKKEWQKK